MSSTDIAEGCINQSLVKMVLSPKVNILKRDGYNINFLAMKAMISELLFHQKVIPKTCG